MRRGAPTAHPRLLAVAAVAVAFVVGIVAGGQVEAKVDS